MKKILFPTDFSKASKNAFIYALHLAKSVKAEILTLHVYELPQISYIEFPIYLPDLYEVTELSSFENYKGHIPMLHKIAQANHLDQIKISNILENGDLIDNIRSIVKKEHIDYIVIGTKGNTGFSSTFLGTVAQKIIKQSGAVVLSIPENCHFKQINKILFATKCNESDLKIIDEILALGKVFNCHVECLFVETSDLKEKSTVIENWKKLYTGRNISFHSLASQDVEGTILNFMELHKINLLAITIHHRNFFENLFHLSITNKMSFNTDVPILTLPE